MQNSFWHLILGIHSLRHRKSQKTFNSDTVKISKAFAAQIPKWWTYGACPLFYPCEHVPWHLSHTQGAQLPLWGRLTREANGTRSSSGIWQSFELGRMLGLWNGCKETLKAGKSSRDLHIFFKAKAQRFELDWVIRPAKLQQHWASVAPGIPNLERFKPLCKHFRCFRL